MTIRFMYSCPVQFCARCGVAFFLIIINIIGQDYIVNYDEVHWVFESYKGIKYE